jgi:hypothetical protein
VGGVGCRGDAGGVCVGVGVQVPVAHTPVARLLRTAALGFR